MLTFNLKKEWFEKIKSGEKTHKYREVKEYWVKRLNNYINHPFRYNMIKFKKGYLKGNELYANVKEIKIINGKNTDLAIDKDVFDIEFELIKA